jgi:hypothetical protein
MHISTHRRSSWIILTLCLGFAAALAGWNRASHGQLPNKLAVAPPALSKQQPAAKGRGLHAFMRKKLDASSQVLEGLCTEDMALVAEGAKQLHRMSEAENWHVSNDVMYKQFSNEFREITKQLVKAAEEKNADRATLKWLDATVSCLDCHRFVRGIRIVDGSPRSGPKLP